MRLRSHTARKHFPQLPDDLWCIILDIVLNNLDNTLLYVLYRTRLRLTCKTFAQRSVFYSTLMLHQASIHFVHNFFRNWSIDTTRLHHIHLNECSLTARDQLALSSCTWNISALYIRDCNFGDYFFSLFLSKLNMSRHHHYQFIIYENFGLLSSYQLALLLKRFHTMHMQDNDVNLLIRWQERTWQHTLGNTDTRDYFKKWGYIHAALRELSLPNSGASDARIVSKIDIATGTESLYPSYINRPPSAHFTWNDHSSKLYHSAFTFSDFPLTDIEPPILDNVKVCMRGNVQETNRRTSPRLLCQ